MLQTMIITLSLWTLRVNYFSAEGPPCGGFNIILEPNQLEKLSNFALSEAAFCIRLRGLKILGNAEIQQQHHCALILCCVARW